MIVLKAHCFPSLKEIPSPPPVIFVRHLWPCFWFSAVDKVKQHGSSLLNLMSYYYFGLWNLSPYVFSEYP